MIREFRKYATGFLAKFLMIILAASFVMWGIADVFKTGIGGQSVATVGSASISPQEFQQQMNRQLENYRQLLGQEYSPELISKLGVPQQVLSQMISALLLKQEAESLGVSLSDAEIMKTISQNPNFQGSKGFDKDMFHTMLQRSGLSEEAYLHSLKDETHTNLLLEPLVGSMLVQHSALEALYRLRGESREAKLYQFSTKALGELPAPSDKELETYYNNHADDFRTTEYRQLNYVMIEPSTLKNSLKISATELRDLYESRKENYRTEERRKVFQLLYSSRDMAINAQTLLQQGKTLKEVAEKLKPENQELDLGFITQSDLVEAARDEVFALNKGSFSNPIETPFGWHIFQVTDIESAKLPDFSDIEPQLKSELQEDKLEDSLYQLSTQLEDALAGGASLKEAAKNLELKLISTAYFDRQGKGEKNEVVTLPPVEKIIPQSFSGELENNPEFRTGRDGNYYFAAIKNVKESVLPKLQDIKPAVLTAWREESAAQELEKRVRAIATKLREGKKEALLDLPYKEIASGKLSRSVTKEAAAAHGIEVPAALREELFSLQDNGYTQAYQTPDGTWLIAQLTTRHPLEQKEISNADLESLRNELTEQYSNELSGYYLAALRTKYPVSVNEGLLQSMLK